MNILVNDTATEVPTGATVADLLQLLDKQQHVAVELNMEVVPRRTHAEVQLTDGDSVELVTLVGGG
jgi:thiamine biosynthesis protein ThiS